MKKIWSLFLCLLLSYSLKTPAAEPRTSPATAIIVCADSRELLDWTLEFISVAQESIEWSGCIIGGEVLHKVLDAFEQRMQAVPNLQIYLLYSPVLVDQKDNARLTHLKKRYPSQFHLQSTKSVPIVLPNITVSDNHVKLLVVDETYFSVGGTNIEDTMCTEGLETPYRQDRIRGVIGENLSAASRDQDIVGRGALAYEIRQHFHALYQVWEQYNKTQIFQPQLAGSWSHTRYFPLHLPLPYATRFENCERLLALPPDKIRFFLGGSHQKKNVITETYHSLFEKAQKEIILGHLYFAPVPHLFEALLGAVQRNIPVTVITNALSDISPPTTRLFGWANRMQYCPLFYGRPFRFWEAYQAYQTSPKRGVKIFEYAVPDTLYHKKVAVVDRRYVCIGSYNFGLRSHQSDYESILWIDSPEVAAAVLKVLQKDIEKSTSVSSEEARRWYFHPVISYQGEIRKRIHGLM